MSVRLGRPDEARNLWETATAPSKALRQQRFATVDWIEQNPESAIEQFRQVAAPEPDNGDAWWALAWLHAESHHTEETVAACREGLNCSSLSGRQRTQLTELQKMADHVLSLRTGSGR